MGCDIHLYVEHRTDAGWEHAPNPGTEEDRYYRTDKWYDGRNYDLFAILANVRNGIGFAGVHTGDGFNPIDMPRGLPHDVSDPVRAESDKWDSDGHSHSWFTVGEVLAYDWDQEAAKTGLFNDFGREWIAAPPNPRYANGGFVEAMQKYADTYHELPPWGGSYCAGVSGPSAHEYKRVTWTQAYHRCASMEWWASVVRAYRLSNGDASSVRFVFWFDN